MTTELEAAIERVKRYFAGEHPYETHDDETEPFRTDCITIASAHIAHLEAEAERKRERAEAVTAERLKALGFVEVESDMGPDYDNHLERGRLNLWEFNRTGQWLVNEADWMSLNSMGQVLDLLAALRGEA